MVRTVNRYILVLRPENQGARMKMRAFNQGAVMKTLSKYAGILFFMAAVALPAQAGQDHGMLQARVKVALNEMVQDVKAAGTPAAKREVMEHFLGKIQHRAGLAGKIPFLPAENRSALNLLQGKFVGYEATLKGTPGMGGVEDKDLDSFASFVQQDLEQAAEASWGNGGIYLSAGAIIIILLILILIT
jgi:hypothetical protein